ncbi:MAG: PhoH family protein [Planctomycetota bacterium]
MSQTTTPAAPASSEPPDPRPARTTPPADTTAASAAAPGPAPETSPEAQSEAEAIKRFVVDTNVLLHNPAALYLFAEHEVVIPFAVLGEIDKFKKGNDDVARNARETIRQLDRLRAQGRLADGIVWNDQGGKVRVELADPQRPDALREDTPDHRIIGVAWKLQNAGQHAVLITKDINVRIKADALGIRTEDFEAQKVDADSLYTGYVELAVPGDLIDRLYDEKQLELEALSGHLFHEEADGTRTPLELETNQFVQLGNALDESHHGLARRLADTDHLIPIHGPRKPTYGVMHRNVQQLMALDLLLDDEVKLVTLLGSAGTGKTLLALAAGMGRVVGDQRYDKLLVARPIMPMGRDLGYLPGDKDEKLWAWMQPIFDNLEYLLSNRAAGDLRGHHADSKPPEARVKELVSQGTVVLEPLTYIRGRSIPHQFIIVDEAQNLTPHEVKTIVSRVGEGTKIVLTGDVNQIDNPYLDASSNGLAYMVERLRGSAQVGHVTLQRSERSELASLAAEKL